MGIQGRIKAFEILGNYLEQFSFASFQEKGDLKEINEAFALETGKIIESTQYSNAWFTPEFIRLSFYNLSLALKKENLEYWTGLYPDLGRRERVPKNIGLIMAGNIPLVGFHDFFCTIMSGNHCRIKFSSKDDKLFPHIFSLLSFIEPELKHSTAIEEGSLTNPDAIIATGSNNSSRYFEYYFGKYPHIIRKNRNSIGIIRANTSNAQMTKLADDIFSYFGMGCRNISKVFLPEGFDIPELLKNFESYSYLYNHNKYANNYDYHKAINLVSSIPFYDTGFLVFKEDPSYSSPVGSLYYEYYSSEDQLKNKLLSDQELLQCIVSAPGNIPGSVDFGSTQTPMLWDYADNVDTMRFLLGLS